MSYFRERWSNNWRHSSQDYRVREQDLNRIRYNTSTSHYIPGLIYEEDMVYSDDCDDKYIKDFENDKRKYEENNKDNIYIPSIKRKIKRRPFIKRSLSLHRTVPITSYGIILYTIEEDNIYFLLAQRRDTIAYVDFLRGGFHSGNLYEYFRLMTENERQRLSKYDFDDLWGDLWINHDSKLYRQEYRKAKKIFSLIQSRIPHYLETIESETPEPQWGFPKGKKHIQEREIDCAIREFIEETKMNMNDIEIRKTSPMVEVFQGFNRKVYKTIYYVAEAKERNPIKYIQLFQNPLRQNTVSEEIGEMKWLPLIDAKELLNPVRQDILNQVYLMILHDDWKECNEPLNLFYEDNEPVCDTDSDE
jgi:8-oxo-dGTP pyrophosphatase MutT (NUDIX family)